MAAGFRSITITGSAVLLYCAAVAFVPGILRWSEVSGHRRYHEGGIDAILHLGDRLETLVEWARVLDHGGRVCSPTAPCRLAP